MESLHISAPQDPLAVFIDYFYGDRWKGPEGEEGKGWERRGQGVEEEESISRILLLLDGLTEVTTDTTDRN